MRKSVQIASLLVAAAILGGVSLPTWAVDGVILIDQNKAMAGGVTPGDAPGFPVTISLPGSYRLGGNLTVTSGNTTAIQINVDNVTIDLNGFQIAGPGVTGSGIGVDATNRAGIVVSNGTIFRMGSSGIVTGPSARIEKVQANNNGNNGIDVGTISVVSDSIAHNNNGSGIQTTSRCLIQNNNASFNGIVGIFSITLGLVPNNEVACIIRGNTVSRNLAGGISVDHAIITGNTVMANGGDGISTNVGMPSVVSGNVITENAGDGISMGLGTVTGNSIFGNSGSGLDVDTFLSTLALGYKGNTFGANALGDVHVFFGTAINLGDNICGGALCP